MPLCFQQFCENQNKITFWLPQLCGDENKKPIWFQHFCGDNDKMLFWFQHFCGHLDKKPFRFAHICGNRNKKPIWRPATLRKGQKRPSFNKKKSHIPYSLRELKTTKLPAKNPEPFIYTTPPNSRKSYAATVLKMQMKREPESVFINPISRSARIWQKNSRQF